MTRLSRRGFLKGGVALGAGAVLYRYAGGWTIVTRAAGPETRRMRLIHTNDHHARIEPASFRVGTGANNAAINRNFGGVARRQTLFKQVRADAAVQDKLFVDAGDIFQGTLYFNLYNGKADRFFYNRLGYAASAIGNHEFDKGDQTLADFISGVPIAQGQNPEPLAFPLVASNITAVAPSPLAALYQEVVEVTITNAGAVTTTTPGKWCKRAIVTMPSGEKVGLVGLTTVETTNIASPSANVSFDANYATVVNAQATLLRNAGCRTVIALTHIGYTADLALAPQLNGVNVIIGGHSHTPLLPVVPEGTPQPFGTTSQGPYPTLRTGADGNSVVIVQDWQWGLWVGDLTVGFDANGVVTTVTSGVVRPVWADGLGSPPRALLTNEGPEITPDDEFQREITTSFKPGVDALGNQVIGTNERALSNANARAGETELGNFIADAIRDRVARFADNTPNIPLVAIVNGGGIRANIDAGPITVGEVLTVMPFANTISRVDVTGAQLKAALENGVSALQPGAALDRSRNAVGSGRFPNVSGMRYTVDVRQPAAQAAEPQASPPIPARPGQRITRVEILERQSDGTDRFVPLDLAKRYRVATLNFVMNGGDGYTVFAPLAPNATDLSADPSVGRGTNQLDSGQIDADVVQEFIRAQPNSVVRPVLERRITVIRSVVYAPIIANRAGVPVTP